MPRRNFQEASLVRPYSPLFQSANCCNSAKVLPKGSEVTAAVHSLPSPAETICDLESDVESVDCPRTSSPSSGGRKKRKRCDSDAATDNPKKRPNNSLPQQTLTTGCEAHGIDLQSWLSQSSAEHWSFDTTTPPAVQTVEIDDFADLEYCQYDFPSDLLRPRPSGVGKSYDCNFRKWIFPMDLLSTVPDTLTGSPGSYGLGQGCTSTDMSRLELNLVDDLFGSEPQCESSLYQFCFL
jgi:hypothetical protein